MPQVIPTYIERQFTFSSDLSIALLCGEITVVPLVLAYLAVNTFLSNRYIINTNSADNYLKLVGVMMILIFGYLVALHLYMALKLRQRNQEITALAGSHRTDWQFSEVPPATPEFFNAALFLFAKYDLKTSNYIRSSEWSYMDVSYAVYKDNKKTSTIYYAMMATLLPRILPNVFFDSKMDQNREFKATFAADQRHQLEGNFNKYFDVYFAEGYTIDSLSFITPDVMQAMIQASEYDIEIVGNHLLLYGPMSGVNQQLLAMSRFILDIKHTLMITAAAYQDDRVSSAKRSKAVSPKGMYLAQKQPTLMLTIVNCALIIMYYLIQIIHAIRH